MPKTEGEQSRQILKNLQWPQGPQGPFARIGVLKHTSEAGGAISLDGPSLTKSGHLVFCEILRFNPPGTDLPVVPDVDFETLEQQVPQHVIVWRFPTEGPVPKFSTLFYKPNQKDETTSK